MNNILVIRFSSLGDIILITGVLKYIKEIRPEINICVATSAQFQDVFKDLPFIKKVYCIDRKAGFKELYTFSLSLPKFDAVFDLHNNLRSNILKILLKTKRFTYEKNSLARRLFVKFRICGKYLKKHTTQKYFEPFGKSFNIPSPDIENLRPVLSLAKRTEPNSKTVVIHPFASKICKQWPYIHELCDKFIKNGFKVIVVGDGKISLPHGAEDKTGFIPLQSLKENISLANLFITTDSGPMHIGAAVDVPTVAIFGPTTKELGFYPYFKNCFVIENDNLACRPCHIHGPNICPKGHFQCMKALTADFIFNFCLSKVK